MRAGRGRRFRRGAVTDGGVRRRGLEQAVKQGFDVHGSAAGGDGGLAAGLDVRDGILGQFQKAVHAEGFAGFYDIDKVVGDLPAALGIRLGGADIHPPIDFHRIDADDFGIKPTGQVKGQGAFADGGDTEN